MKVEVEIQELISNPNISSTIAGLDVNTKDIPVSKAKEATTKAIEDIRVTADIDILADIKNETNKELQVIEEANTEKYRNSILEESIQALKKDSCKSKKDITAKVAAINVFRDSTEHRIKSLRQLLRENTYIKDITEKFAKGN